jgi:predicted regulator of Ras-like GTPase activity (Roadblock/LC7/MglB family)
VPAEPPPDPALVFESMASGPVLGVLLLDRRGLVLAGSLRGAPPGAAEELGASLGGAIDEAVRTVAHLSLGTWQGMLLECEAASLHVASVGGSALVVVAAQRGSPAGWMLRTAAHAAAIAERFVEVYS